MIQYRHASPRRNSGFILIITVMFMAILLIFSISTLNMNVMQERMVGNSKDQNLAFQAAEAALRDAETDIQNNAGTYVFSAACAQGLCTTATIGATPGTPVWQTTAWANDLAAGDSGNQVSRVYGSITGATILANVAQQPHYIIEQMDNVIVTQGQSVALGVKPTALAKSYRITVTATGSKLETKATIQSIYVN